MNYGQSTAKNFTILTAAGIANKLLSLMYVTLQTWLVGNVGNGIITAGFKIYIFVFALSNAGIPPAIAKLVSEQTAIGNYKDSHKTLKIAYFMLAMLGFIFSIITAVFSKDVADLIGVPKAHYSILALAPTMLFTSISSAIRGYFQGRSNMIPTAISQILEQALNSILTVVFITLLIKTYGHNLEIAAIGSSMGTSTGALGAALFLTYTYFKNKREFNREIITSEYMGPYMTSKEIAKNLILFGFPIILGSIAINAADLIDVALVSNRLIRGGYTQDSAAGLFGILSNQYQRILNLPLSITAVLPSALIPVISYAAAIKDNEMISRKINEAFKVIFIIIIPSAVGLALLPKQITALVFFSLHKFNSRPDLLVIGSWVIIFNAVIYIQNSALIGVGKTYISPINTVIGLVLKIIINYFLIPITFINVRGAIIGTTLGYAVTCFLNQRKIKQYITIKTDYRNFILKPVISSIGMAITAYLSFYSLNFLLFKLMPIELLVNDIALIVAILLGILVYGFILMYLGGIKSKDITRLPLGTKLNTFLCRCPLLSEKLN